MVPFAAADWPPGSLREAAQHLWDWHTAARSVEWAVEADIADDVRRRAELVCERHNLPRRLLDRQLVAARNAGHCTGFATAVHLASHIDATSGAHAMLLTRLAGEHGRWIEKPVYAFAQAIFLTRSLYALKEDLAANHLYLPQDAIEKAGVTLQQLANGRMDAAIRRLLWTQVVRARDAYAGSRVLTLDLSGWKRRVCRRYWTGGLHLLGLIEARRFDVWSKPVSLSAIRRAQVYWQMYFGRK